MNLKRSIAFSVVLFLLCKISRILEIREKAELTGLTESGLETMEVINMRFEVQ